MSEILRRPGPEVIALARETLMHADRYPGKAEARGQLLRRHPEYRLRVDTARLQAIIPYKEFKCHPTCSIARDEARLGSDIDAGLVVLSERLVPADQLRAELRFVEDLRDQGFDVFHPTHVTEIQETLAMTETNQKGRLLAELIKRQWSVIRFHTVEELLERSDAAILPHETMIYLAGYRIPDFGKK